MTSLWATSFIQIAYLTVNVLPSRPVCKFLLLVCFSSWVECLLVLGCCPSFMLLYECRLLPFIYATLWMLHASHASQGSAKQTLFPSVGCLLGFRAKDLCSKPLFPFTKGSLNGRLHCNFWRMAYNRWQLRASNRFTWLTNVPKMFGYNVH
jgi:hypothetical protein